nr:PP2C family protein-serine/threonine phosphatase [uncultured Holophaga sp.]
MSADAGASSPFDRLRELSLKIPEGARELLPLVDFLEAFPLQLTEESLIHLVGMMSMGIARAGQGGLWDGRRWLFLKGNAPAFPLHPGPGWVSLPWTHGDELFGHMVLHSTEAPPALELLLSVSGPLLAWRRLEALRSEQNRALALQFSRLNALFDLTRHLGGVETREGLAELLLGTLVREFQMPRLLLLGPEGEVVASRGLDEVPPRLLGEELSQVIATEGLVHVHELQDQDRSHGFIYGAEPLTGPLNEEDELFLQTLVNLVTGQFTALDLRESRIQSLRMEKDLETARNIQQRLLPRHLPQPPGWECAAVNLPFQAVGGDLYDLWISRESRLHVAVGDISGKGLPAALVMAQLSAFLRAMADQRVRDWGGLARRLNERMNQVRDRNRFATLFAASLNPLNGNLRFVNAGHNPALLIPDQGPIQFLGATGPIIGLLPGAEFREGSTVMGPGDTLLIFTDGVVETENIAGVELGPEALAEVVRSSPGLGAEELLEAILVRTFEHMTGGRFRDDATLVVIRRKAVMPALRIG